MRHLHQTVSAPMTPIHLMGRAGHRRPLTIRRNHHLSAMVHAPETPFHSLGAAAQIVGASSPIASVATTALLSDTAVGSWAGPIGAGVGAVVGLISGLLAGHELRAKQARNENSAVNIGVSGFDSDLRKVQSTFKSGQISSADVLQAAQTVMQGYWTVVVPQIQPGRNGCSSGASCNNYSYPAGTQPCKGDIGAACCVGCYQLGPGIFGPNGVLAAAQGQSQSSSGPYTAEIPKVSPSGYGTAARGAYTLDFTPTAAASGVSAALSSIPGGVGLMPLLLAGLAAWLVLR